MKSPESKEAEGGKPLRSWDTLQVLKYLLVEQAQPIAGPHIAFRKAEGSLSTCRIARDCELGAADILAAK